LKPKDRRDIDWLEDILEGIRRIEQYTSDVLEQRFMADGLLQDAVCRNFEVIGEAAYNLMAHCPLVIAKAGDIRWKVMYRMRNALIHGYYIVDYPTVWKSLKEDVPLLRERVLQLIEGIRSASRQ
jgi:uncharacterized protein with HEPN domain